MKPAVIIGNGVTRKHIRLHKLVGKAPLYGCNALYREFHKWDYLIAIDDGMIEELHRERVDDGDLVIPPEDNRWESKEFSPNRRRNNAGMIAMETAIKHGNDVLYCIGFDFILSGDISVDNVFKNTENYGPETHAREEDNFHRVRYLEWFASQHKNTTFIFVVPDENISDVKTIEGLNITAMRTRDFLKKLED